METIIWNKEYREDLGTKDANGYYDYAYCYYVYWFLLPDKRLIRIRRYTDTSEECSLFGFYELSDPSSVTENLTEESIYKPPYISKIIKFMIDKEETTHFKYFAHEYIDIKVSKLNLSLPSDCSLIEGKIDFK